MISSRQLRAIATSPHRYARFVAFGQLPRVVRPASPLIDLLVQLGARDRAAIIGVTVGSSLGYSHSRQFHSADAALNWIRPAAEVLEDEIWPAETYRIKGFCQFLTLNDLLECASSFPAGIQQRYPRLMRLVESDEADKLDAPTP